MAKATAATEIYKAYLFIMINFSGLQIYVGSGVVRYCLVGEDCHKLALQEFEARIEEVVVGSEELKRIDES